MSLGGIFINRYKRLATDTLLFTISTFSSKILSIIMLPFYTHILSTGDYGQADVITTTVNLLLPVFTLSISDAVLRFCLEKNANKKSVFSIGLKVSVGGTCILLVLSPVALFLGMSKPLYFLFLCTYISGMFSTLLSQFSRGAGKTIHFAISGILTTAVTVTLNVIFLVVIKLGLIGYLLSTVLANLVCSIYLSCGLKIWRFVSLKRQSHEQKSEMLRYAAPLIPNNIAWWINFSSDRYILMLFTGAGATGIYAVANKLPTMISSVADIFIRAWQISAVSAYDAEDRNAYYNRVFRFYNFVLLLGCSAAILCTQLIARVLFSSEFYIAWKIAPFLLVSAVFSALNGFIGSLYTTCKNTKVVFHTTLLGAATNVLLNVLLIPSLEGMGAAVATLVSFAVIWAVRAYTLPADFKDINICAGEYLLCYGLLLLQCIILSYELPFAYPLMSIILISIIFVFRRDVKMIRDLLLAMLKKKKTFE